VGLLLKNSHVAMSQNIAKAFAPRKFFLHLYMNAVKHLTYLLSEELQSAPTPLESYICALFLALEHGALQSNPVYKY
jgi:hypothetical protein